MVMLEVVVVKGGWWGSGGRVGGGGGGMERETEKRVFFVFVCLCSRKLKELGNDASEIINDKHL